MLPPLLVKKASNLANLIDEISMWLDASKHELLAKKIAFKLGQYATEMMEFGKHADVWVLHIFKPFNAMPAFTGEIEWPEPIRAIPVHFNPKGAVSLFGTSTVNLNPGLQMLKEQVPELEVATDLEWQSPEDYGIYDADGNFMASLYKNDSGYGYISNLLGNLEMDTEYIKGPYDTRRPDNEHKFLIYDQIRNIFKQLAVFIEDAARNKRFDEIYKLGIAIKNLLAKIDIKPTPDEEMDFAKFDELRVRPEKKPQDIETESSIQPLLKKTALDEHEVIKFFSGKMEAEVKAYDPEEGRFNILTTKHFKQAGPAFSYASNLVKKFPNFQVFVVLSWRNSSPTKWPEEALKDPDFEKSGGTWAKIEYKSTGGGPLEKNREIYGYLDAFGKAHTVGEDK